MGFPLVTEYGRPFSKPGFGKRFFVFLFFSFPFARMAFGLSELFDDRIRRAVSKTGVGRRFFLFSFPVTWQTVSLSEFLDYRIRRAVSKTGVGRKSFFQAEPGRKPRGTWMKKQRFFPRKQPGREAPLLEGVSRSDGGSKRAAFFSQTAFFRGMSPVPLSLLWVGHSRLPARSVLFVCHWQTAPPFLLR